MKNHDVITNEKNFYDQPVDSGIGRYKEIKLREIQRNNRTR